MPADDPLGFLLSLAQESQEDLALSLNISSSADNAAPFLAPSGVIFGVEAPRATPPRTEASPLFAEIGPLPPPPGPGRDPVPLPPLPGHPEMTVEELMLQWRADLEASGEPVVRDVVETTRGVRVAPPDDDDDIEAHPIVLDSSETSGGRLFSSMDAASPSLMSDNFVGDEGDAEDAGPAAADAGSSDSDDSAPRPPRVGVVSGGQAEGAVLSMWGSRGLEGRSNNAGPSRRHPLATSTSASDADETAFETPTEAFCLDPTFDYDAAPRTPRPPLASLVADYQRRRADGAEMRLDILG